MKNITHLIILLALFSIIPSAQAAQIPCTNEAIDRAKKLLTFHAGEDDRISIKPTVKVLPSIRNPANSKQKFQILEVWGYIYKGKYRMRFTHYNSPQTSCLLMGQEIFGICNPLEMRI